MKNRYFAKMLLGCSLCVLIAVFGCCIQAGCNIPRAKYQRTVELSEPLAAGHVFATQTHNGSITIKGAEITECNMTATIIARAGSEEEAKSIAEETEIKLEMFGEKLIAKIEKPHLVSNQSVSVNFDVAVPNRTDLQLNTHNGAVEITDITGNTQAVTHNGNINASRISGTTKLQTHNGAITCNEVLGDVNLRTHNGSIGASYRESGSPVCDVSMETHNGNIDFQSAPNFSAKVDISTHNGTVTTDLPIMVTGTLSKRKLSGTIGTGQGVLRLGTHNGSIRIR